MSISPAALEAAAAGEVLVGGAPVLVPLSALVDNPWQTRHAYDAEKLAAIAASVEQRGLLQAPIGRRRGEVVELAFGHSRRRAFDLLAEKSPARFGAMPVVLHDLTDEDMALHAWFENKDRADLSAFEEAQAIARFMADFGWNQSEAARRLNMNRPTLANKLRLLELPGPALELFKAGQLSERQAMALLPLGALPAPLFNRTGPSVSTGAGWVSSAVELVKAAPATESGRLREAVKRLIEGITIPLAQAPFAGQVLELEGVHAPVCTACPIRLKSENRCPDRGCYDVKAGAYSRAQLAAAAAQTGVPATELREYGQVDSLEGLELSAVLATAAEKGCGRLSVANMAGREHAIAHPVEGHAGCAFVCAHGQSGRCKCRMALAKAGDESVSKDAAAANNKRRIGAELARPAERALVEAFKAGGVEVWRMVLATVAPNVARKLGPADDLDRVLGALAESLVDQRTQVSYGYAPNYDGAARSLEQLLRGAGARVPWAPSDVELEAQAREWLSDAEGSADLGLAPAILGQAVELIGKIYDPALRQLLEGEAARVRDLVEAGQAAARAVGAQTLEAEGGQVVEAVPVPAEDGHGGLALVPVEAPAEGGHALVAGDGLAVEVGPGATAEEGAGFVAWLAELVELEGRLAGGGVLSHPLELDQLADGLAQFAEVLDDPTWDGIMDRIDAAEGLAKRNAQAAAPAGKGKGGKGARK